MQSALQTNAEHTITTDDLLQALQSLEDAIPELLDVGHDLQNTYQQLTEALQTINNLLYLLTNNLLKHMPGSQKYLRYRCDSVHAKLLSACAYFKEPGTLPAKDLIPVKQIVKILSSIINKGSINHELGQLLGMMQEQMALIIQSKTIHYTRWLWWSKCCLELSSIENLEADTAAAVLATLNFNKGCFITWLVAKLDKELSAISAGSQKIEYIAEHLGWFYNLPESEGHCVMQASVKQVMIKALKLRLSIIKHGEQPATSKKVSSPKINTALSVPQLALFVRLMIDSKIINESNNQAILKAAAAAIATGKTNVVSPDSLQVNFYTPNTASKIIIKEYLLQMMRLLNSY